MSYFKIKDPAKRDFLINEYLKLKGKVKSDLLSEKIGDVSMQESLAKTFKPITESQATILQPLVQSTASTLRAIQGIPEQLRAIQGISEYPFATYPISASDIGTQTQTLPVINIGAIAQKYLKGAFSKENKTDTTFGIREKDGVFFIGDKQAYIDNDDILIKDGNNEFKYLGTPGLWELIQSNEPDEIICTDEDKLQYKDLLIRTNNIYQNNDPNQNKPKSSSGKKWRDIIAPIWKEIKDLKGESSKEKKADLIFGIRKENGEYFIGDKQVEIGDDYIFIKDDDIMYDGTPGLWELIQSKEPDENIYTDEDMQQYKDLLIRTNNIYQNNNPNQNKPKSSSGKKWRGIIAPIWKEIKEQKKTSGKGVNSQAIILPQDPNALVERLELLLASKQAGNTGVRNELVSICD